MRLVPLDGHSASIAMRRALSVFRGYRKAGEDDDDVFVCSSPGYKVTTQTSTEGTKTTQHAFALSVLDGDIFTLLSIFNLCPLAD